MAHQSHDHEIEDARRVLVAGTRAIALARFALVNESSCPGLRTDLPRLSEGETQQGRDTPRHFLFLLFFLRD